MNTEESLLDPELQRQDKRQKLSYLDDDKDQSENTQKEPVITVEENINDELKPITASGDRVIRNGISLPSDSMLLNQSSFTYIPEEISSDMLVRANLASLPLTLQASDSLAIRIQLLINSIPLLDNVSTQILRIIGVGPYEETLAILTNEESTPERLVFNDLVELFEQVKRIYSEEDPFLNFQHIVQDIDSINDTTINHLKNLEDPIDSALRKANLATFLLSTLGSVEVGFFFLNESFLDVFCPTINNGWFNHSNFFDGSNHSNSVISGKLLKAQAGLYLELKTQAYISALEAGNRPKEEILEDIFPSNLQDILSKRRKSDKLTPAEVDFVNRCKSRRDTLLNLNDKASEELSENYDWLIFLKELFSYVSKNIGVLIWGKKGRGSLLQSLSKEDLLVTHPYGSLTKQQLQEKLKQQQLKERELKERERLELKRATQSITNMNKKQKSAFTSASVNKVDANLNLNLNLNSNSSQQNQASSGLPRIRNILRRPWSSDEENTLIQALKEFGPHWSKILELYGAGGSKSEALRNRTQVQLKDKARNWKMAYLKTGNPVPEHLSKVTGELERDDRANQSRKKQRKRLQDEKQKRLQEQKQNQRDKYKEKDDGDFKPSLQLENNNSQKEFDKKEINNNLPIDEKKPFEHEKHSTIIEKSSKSSDELQNNNTSESITAENK